MAEYVRLADADEAGRLLVTDLLDGASRETSIQQATLDAAQGWRQVATSLAALAAAARQYPHADYLLLINITRHRDLLRRHVLERYGIDLDHGRVLPSAPPELSLLDVTEAQSAIYLHAFLTVALVAADLASRRSVESGEDHNATVVEAIVGVLESWPLIAGFGVDWLPTPGQRLGATFSLAGWMATGLSGINRRLVDALTADGSTFGEALLNQLPAAAWLAWAEQRPDSMLTSVRAAAARDLARDRHDRDRVRPGIDPATIHVGMPVAAAADLALVHEATRAVGDEEARAVKAHRAMLMDAYGMSGRQAEMWALHQLGASFRAIADRYGVAVGTVKATINAADRKHRRAAS